MKTTPISASDWQGVFPVPPLARRHDAARSIDWDANQKLLDHMTTGGLTRFLYGGNAFLYHVTLAEYEELLAWLQQQPDPLWMIPSAGPSYGRLMDQAQLLKRTAFPCVMHLPCGDPRDAAGLETGLNEFVQAAGMPVIVYLKEENSFGADRAAGLAAIGRLVETGACAGIKYAVVREDPSADPYLRQLLDTVDASIVLSGIGERPAIRHLRDFGLPGYTTGSGCIGAHATQSLFNALQNSDFAAASAIREHFLPLEDLRDAHGPARVLHAAVQLAGLAETGSIPPFLTQLPESLLPQVQQAARSLRQTK
jgi:dihydrodipicolinate synthase/N-acetylneuraminate lyase